MVAMRESSGAALAVGRLTDWEPLGFEAGDNNWYRFVANGPTGKMDPLGLEECVSNYPGTAINFDHFRRLSNGTNFTEDFIQKHANQIAGILVKRMPGALWEPAGVAKVTANLPLMLARFALFNNSDDRQLVGLSAGPTGKMSVRYVKGKIGEEKLIPNSGKPVIFKGPCPDRAFGCWEEREVAKNWCELYDALYEAYELMQAIQEVARK